MRKMLFLLTVTMLAWAGGGAPVARAENMLLLYSNDVHGETEPCG